MPDPSDEVNPPAVGRFVAFRYRDFRLFWTSIFISNIGTWMQMTAINWLLYKLTKSPLQLGLNGLFRAGPALVLGIFSGTLADRYDRKKLLLTTQCLLGTLALILGILDHSENIRPWHIYTMTFLSAAVGSCDGPARHFSHCSFPRRYCRTPWRSMQFFGKALRCLDRCSAASRLA